MTNDTKLRPTSRRRVIGAAIGLLGGSAAVAALMRYLRPRSMDAPRDVFVGEASDARFASAAAAVVHAEGVRVAVRRTAEGRLTAMRLQCTHAGCPLTLEHDHIACRCHGGRFDLDGRPTAGPPKTPLHRMPIREDGGRVYVTMGPDDV